MKRIMIIGFAVFLFNSCADSKQVTSSSEEPTNKVVVEPNTLKKLGEQSEEQEMENNKTSSPMLQ